MGENFFELIIENGVVTGHKGESKVIEIPEGVSEIADNTFLNCKFLEEVNIKSSILKKIGFSAFKDCTNLKSCNIKSLKGLMGDKAFSGCKNLKYLIIPNGVINVGELVFENCKNLLFVALPESVLIFNGPIFDAATKKTVILGTINSETENYAKVHKIPFQEDSQKNRDKFFNIMKENKKNRYKEFTIYGELIKCYSSISVYQELLSFLENSNVDFMNEVFDYIPDEILKGKKDLRKMAFIPEIFIEKAKKLLEKKGVFINDSVFIEAMEQYSSNYIHVCRIFVDTYNSMLVSLLNGTYNLEKQLIAEAESKITGLSYGVIGDSLTLVGYAIDEYREKNRQRRTAYEIANKKISQGSEHIKNEIEKSYVKFVNDTALPELEKAVHYFTEGLTQYIIDEFIKAKIIDKEVFKIYDLAKSNNIIQQASNNINIDKKYAIAMAIKLYPLNMTAIEFAIKNKLVDKNLLHIIDFLNLYNNNLINYFDTNYSYIELVDFLEENSEYIATPLNISLKEKIDSKAVSILNSINEYNYDPIQLSDKEWNKLTSNYTILSTKNSTLLNLSEEEIKGLNGKKTLSEAIEFIKKQKQKEEAEEKKQLQEKVLAEAQKLEKIRLEAEEKEKLDKLSKKQKKEKSKKLIKSILGIISSLIIVVLVLSGVLKFIITPNNYYNTAVELMQQGDYSAALTQLNLIEYKYKDSKIKKQECCYFIATNYLNSNNIKLAALYYGKAGDYQDAKEQSLALWNSFLKRTTLLTNNNIAIGIQSNGIPVVVGLNHNGQCDIHNWSKIIDVSNQNERTIGLKSDGTVVAVGNNSYGQCNVNSWSNVVQIAISDEHTIGLKSDGTVVAVGLNKYGQCDVNKWSDVIQIDTSGNHTVGLKADGTVVAVGDNSDGQCNVSSWSNIVQIATGSNYTVGLRENGTVVAIGDTSDNRCNVIGWTNIVEIFTGGCHTIGLRSNGTVVAVGDNSDGQCNTSGWSNIVQIEVSYNHTIGLKSDGTVIACGKVFADTDISAINNWKKITSIATDSSHILGLKSNGTIVSLYYNETYAGIENWENIVKSIE